MDQMAFDEEIDDEVLPLEVPVLEEGASDKEIEDFFKTGRLSVQKEENKIFLIYVVDFIRGRKWGDLRPEYQRRLRWDNQKKSRLIESFLMNVPVPPVFLYEKSIGEFEVMDGQQRLNAILEFFEGTLELEGLQVWKALNGRRFGDLPPLVRKGLERAAVSTLTLTPEDDETNPYARALRSQVFDRLNTGGEKLNAQELRNALWGGPFNEAVIRLASLKTFTDAWNIPPHAEHILSNGWPDDTLRDNNLYKRMMDVEIVLRFFAFKDTAKIAGSVRKMLDDTAQKGSSLGKADASKLEAEFESTLSFAAEVFGNELFKLAPAGKQEIGLPSRPLYDAVMISMYNLREQAGQIKVKSEHIRQRITEMTTPEAPEYEALVGRANTAQSIKDRIKLVTDEIKKLL
jgi:Protein of unknown function DUF262